MQIPPEISELELEYWRPQAGDILVVKNTEHDIDAQQAAEIRAHVRRSLKVPYDVEIMVLGRDWEVSVKRNDDAAKS